jgi:hypothetical protein
MVRTLYRNEKSALLLNRNLSTAWEVNKGVRQGASSSPLLFNLFPEELLERIKGQEGISFNGIEINVLFYADDLILLADRKQDLQNLIKITEQWTADFDLTMNLDKCEYIILNEQQKGQSINLAGQLIQAAESTTYLGYTRSKKSSAAHIENRLKKTKMSSFNLNSLFKRLPNLRLPIKAKIIDQ